MSSVTEMLAKTHSRYNKGRNRILIAAVCMCILTLTIVFGIASGKIEAEYLKAVREVGTTASACIEKGDKLLYSSALGLPYVKKAGRRVIVGSVRRIKRTPPDCAVCRRWIKMHGSTFKNLHIQMSKVIIRQKSRK